MIDNLINSISKVVIGNKDKIKLVLASIISEGSILIEDYPGTGKTTLAKAITESLKLDFRRVQFTSDLLPSDILGFNMYKGTKPFFQKGPIFTNIVLADELNRGSPKSQSAFMEAMEEKSVTIDGKTYDLPTPFFVIATQNPMDTAGTSLLPDSQLDRFMVSFSLSDLDDDNKIKMLKNKEKISKSTQKLSLKKLKESKEKVNVADTIYNYLIEIEKKTKELNQNIHLSARCLKQIIDLSKGWAVINEKDYVTHQDVKDLLPYVLRHRINFLKPEEKIEFINSEILNKIEIEK